MIEPGAHPIEQESYRLLAERVDLQGRAAGERTIVERVLHATADLSFADSLRLSPGALEAGALALRSGAPIVTDVEMLRAGLSRLDALCYLTEARREGDDGSGLTLSARGIRIGGARHATGAIFAVGCAPTALEALLDLVEDGSVRPALVVGVPVGFVGAAGAKVRLQSTSGLAFVSNAGERGGSAVAVAILNAIAREAL